MKARVTKEGVNVKEIFNEAQKEQLDILIEKSGVTAKYTEMGTKCAITGDFKQVSKFIALWNEET